MFDSARSPHARRVKHRPMRLRSAAITLMLGLTAAALGFPPAASVAQTAFAGFSPAGHGVGFPDAANGRLAETPSIQAYRLNGEEIRVDGRLDDAAWRAAEAGRGFRVWDPDRGAAPSEETVFKVVYDDHAVYFGVACLEEDPSQVSAHLARRDRVSDSDLVSIYIDPLHDRNTGYNFKVNPLGVQLDAYMYNDGDRDEDWDAVWEAETYRDDQGWYAEVRIPFSAIRYRPSDDMTWGLQVYRYMHGRGEDTAWVTWDRETRGFISRFGELRGIRDVQPSRQLAVMPYFLQSTRDPAVVGQSDDLEYTQNVGADIQYGLTSNLTLNATVQPDFGQVESDPATLNLSPFETFYNEKRPFFIEGSRFFQHPDFNLFYSRRIGTGAENSRIRLASKLTGKTSRGTSIAALVATTDITEDGEAYKFFKSGERTTHYAVGRIGQEFAEGAHRVNLMQTAVFNTGSRDDFGDRGSREAYTTGLDFDLNFHDRDYNIQGSVVSSYIDPERSQSDPLLNDDQRFGTGGSLDLRKLGGNMNGGVYGRWESDKLDLNDVGFLSAPDEINTGGWASYHYRPEGKSRFFNQANINYNIWLNWMYGGRTGRDVNTGEVAWSYDGGHEAIHGNNVNSWAQFRNYWEAWWGIEYYPWGTQRYETRGGPLIGEPTTYGWWFGAKTDTRKNVVMSLEGNRYWDKADNLSWRIGGGLDWNQSSALTHGIEVGYGWRTDDTQYLETVDLNERPGGIGIGGLSYVFGDIEQKTLDITLRSSVLFTRNQSLELYLQPYISVGDYSQARELVTPDSYDLQPYAEPGYDASKYDFLYTEVNLNAVYRWEYHPGSTLYVVWTHSRSGLDARGSHSDPAGFSNGISTASLFDQEPENLFQVKLSYRFAM